MRFELIVLAVLIHQSVSPVHCILRSRKLDYRVPFAPLPRRTGRCLLYVVYKLRRNNYKYRLPILDASSARNLLP
jgi:hypothetical protein